MNFNTGDIVFRRFNEHLLMRVVADDGGPTVHVGWLDGLGEPFDTPRAGLLVAQRSK